MWGVVVAGPRNQPTGRLLAELACCVLGLSLARISIAPVIMEADEAIIKPVLIRPPDAAEHSHTLLR
jgi:hypothetical protein